MIVDGKKQCPHCKQWKSVEEFSKNRIRKDGLAVYCKECTAPRTSKWQKEHPDRVRASVIRWRLAHPGAQNASCRKWYAANREHEIARVAANKAAHLEWGRKSDAKRHADPIGRIKHCLSSALLRVLGGQKNSRKLPYAYDEAAAYIQARLEKRSYHCPLCGADLRITGYHIDHRIPTSTATTVEEIYQLFALENLDVLCPTCNIGKGTKIIMY